tara:strand:- start:2117 stop:2467 length:351 start_codon:yes stop_codon:yes gene_type:complete
MRVPTKTEITDYMKLHNSDEVGINNQWDFEEAEYHLLLSDKFYYTKVLFTLIEGEVLALFPEVSEGTKYIGSYMHLGQHSAACKSRLKDKKASAKQYAPLLDELKSIGYNVDVLNK